MHSFLLEKSLPAFGFNAIQHLSGIRYTVYGKPVVNQSDLHQSLGSTRAYAEPASLTGSFSKNLRFLSSAFLCCFCKKLEETHGPQASPDGILEGFFSSFGLGWGAAADTGCSAYSGHHGTWWDIMGRCNNRCFCSAFDVFDPLRVELRLRWNHHRRWDGILVRSLQSNMSAQGEPAPWRTPGWIWS